jgi:hypothetical protein
MSSINMGTCTKKGQINQFINRLAGEVEYTCAISDFRILAFFFRRLFILVDYLDRIE